MSSEHRIDIRNPEDYYHAVGVETTKTKLPQLTRTPILSRMGRSMGRIANSIISVIQGSTGSPEGMTHLPLKRSK